MSQCTSIAHNLATVRSRITRATERAGRDPGEITLVAVSKTVDATCIRAAFELGIRDFGENRVQEAGGKIAQLDIPVTWHMVGHLQTNKVKEAVRIFDVVQSVDSLRLAVALSRHAEAAQRVMRLLLEVNVSGEPQKFGLDPDEVAAVAGEISLLPALASQGLMMVAPLVAKPEEARPFFRRLRELRDELEQRLPGLDWRHLSMGMTDDFDVAIEEGATIVRIGRAIFGERSIKQPWG